MKYLIPDSVADMTHEREIPDHMVAGLPLALAVAIIKAWDGYEISGNDALIQTDESIIYNEEDGVGVLDINTDRSHYYGVVYCPEDHEKAKKAAKKLLASWGEEDNE
jgi:hypothetical protein